MQIRALPTGTIKPKSNLTEAKLKGILKAIKKNCAISKCHMQVSARNRHRKYQMYYFLARPSQLYVYMYILGRGRYI